MPDDYSRQVGFSSVIRIGKYFATTADLSAPSSVRVAASLEVIPTQRLWMASSEGKVSKILSG
jgi:hypothetical protein